MNPIPTQAREAVQARSLGRCERCGGRGGEIHHRRSRRVRDEHCHCLCNLVHLCNTCHRWAHSQRQAAEIEGFMLSQFAWPPGQRFWHASAGVVTPACDGGWVQSTEPGEEKDVLDRRADG